MACLTVRHTVTATADVRHSIAADLRHAHVVPDRIEDIVLVADELLGNAVRHADALTGDLIEIDWTLDRDITRIAVTDGGCPARTTPAPQPPSTSAVRGRGLTIVEALSTRWGVHHSPTGNVTVWAELSSPAAVLT